MWTLTTRPFLVGSCPRCPFRQTFPPRRLLIGGPLSRRRRQPTTKGLTTDPTICHRERDRVRPRTTVVTLFLICTYQVHFLRGSFFCLFWCYHCHFYYFTSWSWPVLGNSLMIFYFSSTFGLLLFYLTPLLSTFVRPVRTSFPVVCNPLWTLSGTLLFPSSLHTQSLVLFRSVERWILNRQKDLHLI